MQAKQYERERFEREREELMHTKFTTNANANNGSASDTSILIDRALEHNSALQVVLPMFKQITFTELDREEAVKVIELYNKVAKEKGYGKKHEDRKLKKFKTGNQRPGNFKGNQNQRGYVE